MVADVSGHELVLKALPSEAWAPTFERGVAIARHMRARGYPAPVYQGTGTALGATWSLQASLPGECPDLVRETHMRRLLELADAHAGASPGPGYDANEEFRGASHSLEAALSLDASRPLGEELALVIDQLGDLPLCQDGVVHGDFHHRNFLAVGDEVTGIFDWEFACTGDWRQDLVTLAYSSALMPEQVPENIGRIAIDHARAACSPEVFAFFAASRALSQLGFAARVRADRLPRIVNTIETAVRSWWQPAAT